MNEEGGKGSYTLIVNNRGRWKKPVYYYTPPKDGVLAIIIIQDGDVVIHAEDGHVEAYKVRQFRTGNGGYDIRFMPIEDIRDYRVPAMLALAGAADNPEEPYSERLREMEGL